MASACVCFSLAVPKSLPLLKPYMTQDIRNDHYFMLSEYMKITKCLSKSH